MGIVDDEHHRADYSPKTPQCLAGDEAHIPVDWILADVLDKRGPYEFVLSEIAHCPKCHGVITEKTLVQPEGGIEVESIA